MEEETTLKIEKILLKHRLLQSDHTLGEYYSKEEDYHKFIALIQSILKYDEYFFLLENDLDELVFNTLLSSTKQGIEKKTREDINEIKVRLNLLKTNRNRSLYLNNYMYNQIHQRLHFAKYFFDLKKEIKKEYGTDDICLAKDRLKEMQIFDYIFYLYIKNKNFPEKIPPEKELLFISSINYLLENIPELFTKEICEITKNLIASIKDRKYRVYKRLVLENLEKTRVIKNGNCNKY